MTDARDNDTSVKMLPAEIPGEVRFLWSRLVTERLMVLKTFQQRKRKKVNFETTTALTNRRRSIIFIRRGYIHLN